MTPMALEKNHCWPESSAFEDFPVWEDKLRTAWQSVPGWLPWSVIRTSDCSRVIERRMAQIAPTLTFNPTSVNCQHTI